jgi:hypothetical protein
MAPTDELALRTALHDLTAEQPEAPVDRLTGVRRRHRRRRGAQAMAAVASAAVIVTGVVATSSGGSTAERPTPATSHEPRAAWQLSWPDRGNGLVDRAEVLLEIEDHEHSPVSRVAWLYAGSPPGSTVRWAVLEGHASSDSAAGGVDRLWALWSDDGGTSWTFSSSSPPPPATQVLGFADRRARTVLVLAAPSVATAELLQIVKDGADATSFQPLVDGAATIRLSGPPTRDQLLVRASGADVSSVVQFADDAPAAYEETSRRWMGRIPHRRGETVTGISFGGTGGAFSYPHSPAIGMVVLEVRCGSPVPFDIKVRTTQTTTISVDRCDGVFHRYETGLFVKRGDAIHVEPVHDLSNENALAATALIFS